MISISGHSYAVQCHCTEASTLTCCILTVVTTLSESQASQMSVLSPATVVASVVLWKPQSPWLTVAVTMERLHTRLAAAPLHTHGAGKPWTAFDEGVDSGASSYTRALSPASTWLGDCGVFRDALHSDELAAAVCICSCRDSCGCVAADRGAAANMAATSHPSSFRRLVPSCPSCAERCGRSLDSLVLNAISIRNGKLLGLTIRWGCCRSGPRRAMRGMASLLAADAHEAPGGAGGGKEEEQLESTVDVQQQQRS